MKKLFSFFIGFFLVLVSYSHVYAQNCNIIYFCEKYDNGEINCSDRFTAGKVTVMVKLINGFDSTSVSLQVTRFVPAEDKFDYYKEIIYDVEKGTKFIFFPNVEFNDKGIFRVFLLDMKKNRIASALIEII